MKWALLSLMFVAVATPLPSSAAATDGGGNKEWDFTVTLDGDAIGTHKFTMAGNPQSDGKAQITSKADFTVTVVGVPVFRYRHSAHEEWKSGCLTGLQADTNYDGGLTHVKAKGSPSGGSIRTDGAEQVDKDQPVSWKGCLMNFAYWNPKMHEQSRLLNPETGEIEPVTITKAPDQDVPWRGQTVHATVWHIVSKHYPIDVLYNDSGEWIGLNSVVKDGRILSYRIP